MTSADRASYPDRLAIDVSTAARSAVRAIRERLKAYIRAVVRDEVSRATQAAPPVPVSAPERILDLHGYARSRAVGAPVAADGSPLPWYTYPAIEFLRGLDLSNLNVFEYGSGNSTIFWSNRGAHVWAVENSAEWHEALLHRATHFKELYLRQERDAFVGAIHEPGCKFDVVIVDGEWRAACAAEAVGRLVAGGMIVLDNADWFPEICDDLNRRGFLQFAFNGMGPLNEYSWTTAVFVAAESLLLSRVRRPAPVGGVEAPRQNP
jgi:hypothetical protein